LAICLDTSAALRWLVPHPSSAAAAAVLGPAFARGELVIAPPLLYAEATSVLRQLVFKNELLQDEARDALHDLLALPIRIMTGNLIYVRALDLAGRFQQRRAYDTQFIAVAEDQGATLVTADGPMFTHSQTLGVPARLLP
jgi:predicted nucleic acid-binding protein